MKERVKKGLFLIIFVISFLAICFIISVVHDFIFDKFSISNYEIKEGIISDVILKEDKESRTCEYIVVNNYNIFVQCGNDYKQKFKTGDNTKYYVYKNKGYHTETQMKSSTTIGKILDYGMIGSYILLFFLITSNRNRISNYIDQISDNKNTNN